ncbi:MAG: proline--tRNA ligase, partial [Verrucomicrobiota bacterium]|nr:proline--tRNA ligase [Verrucomicrobiota bacterium]
MRWSQTFIPTMKESPAEAEIISHKLLLRAGLVRKLTGGLYTFLPVGLRALKKVEKIVREEMDRAGALEVLMPALQPTDIWEKSGRLQSAQDVLFHVNDRSKKDWVLGPTHEEVITTLVASELNSYRQLPVNFYQVQTKFRDEIRPRFGLMRAKEFIMKDAYSFDIEDDSANASYKRMYDAYGRIFARCGLQAFPVQADTGVMGGAHSHEFMVPAETGENEVVYCEAGNYAANMEKATSQGPEIRTPQDACGDLQKFETSNVKTIVELTNKFDVVAERQIKTLVYVADDKPVLLLLRGDDQLEEAKLTTVFSSGAFRPATDTEIYEVLSTRPGSLGAVGVKDIRVIADKALVGASGMVTGANIDGFHLRNVNIERDISIDNWCDLRKVKAGELCIESGRALKIRRAIEVGHVFKLGTKYSEALGATVLDEQGKSVPCIMGCYGIGVTRTLQAIIEQCFDENGINWPTSVA